MESIEFLTGRKLSTYEWLHYYRNVWGRNATARTIDVQCDMTLMEKNPNEQVQVDSQNPMELKFVPIQERLELRKIALQDALNIIEGIDKVLARGLDENNQNVDGKIEDFYFSEEFLKVSDEMAKATQAPEAAPDTTPVPEESKQEEPVAPETATTEATPETAQPEAESQAVEGEAKA